MAARRKRRRYEAKRPKSTIARITAGIGLTVIAAFVICMLLSIFQEEETPRWMGGVGVISMLTSIIGFGYGVGVFRDTGFDTLNRWMGMLLPLVGFVLWVWIYLTGILWG